MRYTLFTISGIGSSLTMTTIYIVIGYNFNRHLDVASGITTSGVSLGCLVMPPVVDLLRTHYGNRMYFVILGGMALQQCVLGLLYFPSYIEQSKKHVHISDAHNGKTMVFKSMWTECIAVLKIPAFLCFAGYMCLMQLGAFITYLHFPEFVITMGYTSLQAAFLLTIRGSCSLLARLLLAAMANSNSYHADLTTVVFGISTLMSLASMLLPLYGTTFLGLLMFSVLGGFYSDSAFALLNTLTIQIVGLDRFAMATGINVTLMGIGIFCGPIIVGRYCICMQCNK